MNQFNLDSLVRDNVKKLVAYSSARSEFDGEAQVFLDANENSLGSFIGENINRYPDPLQKKLKEEISKLKEISVKKIFVGNGSDEAIDLLIRAFCKPSKDNILIFPPTYGMYEVSAEINDVAVKKVLLGNDFQIDPEAALKAVDDDTKIIFICSPNNPTGNLFREKDIRKIIENCGCIVVVDEAYIDFTETQSWIRKIDEHPNLVIMQTLSKAWAMAGLRLGMAFASEAIIEILNKIKPPYNINSITQKTAIEVLRHKEDTQQKIEILKAEREKLLTSFPAFDFIKKVYPSDANFILVKVDTAAALYNYLLSKKIVVRNRSSQPLCENCIRITVGTPDENLQLIEALKNYPV